jgi:hypothetical protein
LLIFAAIFGSAAIRDCKRTQDRHTSSFEIAASLVNDTVDNKKMQVQRDCADPGSHECRRWVAFVPSLWVESREIGSPTPDPDGPVNSAPSSPDVGIRLEDLPTIGKPGEPIPARHRPKHHRQ